MKALSRQRLEALDEQHRRNLGWIARSDSDILVHSSDNPAGYRIPLHCHRHDQLLCAFAGVVLVETERGCWMIPPGHALLIPAQLQHAVEMLSAVDMKSVYLLPGLGDLAGRMLQVLGVTDLARALIGEAIRLRDAAPGTRKAVLVLELLAQEIATLEARPLGLPFPADRRLAALCRSYMAAPSADERLGDWAGKLAMSRRTFTRHFSKATGMSLGDWLVNERLQRTRELLESTALPVESISDLVGFATPTSLRQHFKRRNQVSPSEWRRTFGRG